MSKALLHFFNLGVVIILLWEAENAEYSAEYSLGSAVVDLNRAAETPITAAQKINLHKEDSHVRLHHLLAGLARHLSSFHGRYHFFQRHTVTQLFGLI